MTNDILHTFGWKRQPDPHNYAGNGPPSSSCRRPADHRADSLVRRPGDLREFALAKNWGQARRTRSTVRASRASPVPGSGTPSAVRPWARLILIYQRYFYLRGTLLGLIVLIGAAGVLARWRRWGGVGLLPWLVGALLVVLPPMTAGFSYRYVLAAVPAACLAAGLAFVPGDKSVGALAANLRRHFGGGVAVEQE